MVRRHLAWTGLGVGESFVDVGCGTGECVAAAYELNGGAPVVGIDADEHRLAHARAATQRAGAPAARFLAARIDGPGSSGLEDGAFDHAWSRFFLGYQPSPASAVGEMVRVVREGGRVTLIDIEGNCTWHAGMDPALRRELDAIIADLATTGFDPDAGRELSHYAAQAGLVDTRHTAEHYHRVIATPDRHSAAAWSADMAGDVLGWHISGGGTRIASRRSRRGRASLCPRCRAARHRVSRSISTVRGSHALLRCRAGQKLHGLRLGRYELDVGPDVFEV
jgi:SAM-dependent methyltransferase